MLSSEYGWTHHHILDNMTPSQMQLYVRMAYFRKDEDRKHKEELAIMAAGGDLKEYHLKRKTLRERFAGADNKVKPEKEEVTSKQFLEMAARMKVPVKTASGGTGRI